MMPMNFEPVLGTAGIKMTMSDEQAMAYVLLVMDAVFAGGIRDRLDEWLKIPDGYTYAGAVELMEQARRRAVEIWQDKL